MHTTTALDGAIPQANTARTHMNKLHLLMLALRAEKCTTTTNNSNMKSAKEKQKRKNHEIIIFT